MDAMGTVKLPHTTQSSSPNQGLWSGCTTNRRLFRCTDTCHMQWWSVDMGKWQKKTFKKNDSHFPGPDTCFGSCEFFASDSVVFWWKKREYCTILGGISSSDSKITGPERHSNFLRHSNHSKESINRPNSTWVGISILPREWIPYVVLGAAQNTSMLVLEVWPKVEWKPNSKWVKLSR